MTIQKNVKPNICDVKSVPSFRTIHYLGSKLRVLDFIKDVVDEIDPDKNGVCDLFSGAGSVNQLLSSERKIVSIDIQNYSNIICNALLKPVSDEFIDSFTNILIFFHRLLNLKKI
jgi:adenine-specific DNA methylase